MDLKDPTFINPYTDFGFKKLFGEEANKPLLIDFLNELLPPHHRIAELEFKNSEVLPENSDARKAFFDVHCQSVTGETFIVEMQKAKLDFFKDRALFYTSFPIRQQAMRSGKWDYKLEPIYFIAILDFWYDESRELAKFRRDVCLRDQDCEVFFDKLHFKFLQMPAFTKTEAELVTHFDKWCYFLKNLESFDEIPQILREPIFEQAFRTARFANFTSEERMAYELSILDYIGLKALDATARREGREEGIIEGIEQRDVETVWRLHDKGKSVPEIADLLGLEEARVQEILSRAR